MDETAAEALVPWRAPEFVSPEEFEALLDALVAQSVSLSRREAHLARLAGEWDALLREWHEESVFVVTNARGRFRDTAAAGGWRGVKARGGGRGLIAKEGAEIEAAWQAGDAAWEPKPGMTVGAFRKRRVDAGKKSMAHARAAKRLANERGALLAAADVLYGLCVYWYEVAGATFDAGTPAGALLRTIPTNYDLKEAEPPRPEPPALRARVVEAETAQDAA